MLKPSREKMLALVIAWGALLAMGCGNSSNPAPVFEDSGFDEFERFTPETVAPKIPPIEPSGIQGWRLDPTTLASLGPYVDLEGYTFRPPAGYEMKTVTMNGVPTYHFSKKEEGPFTTTESMEITIGQLKNRNRRTEDVLTNALELSKFHYANWKGEAIHQGTINGLTFQRVHWSAYVPELTKNARGFTYVCLDGPVVILVEMDGYSPDDDETLLLSEISVLTFQRGPPPDGSTSSAFGE
jgi:hypothetical protein